MVLLFANNKITFNSDKHVHLIIESMQNVFWLKNANVLSRDGQKDIINRH